MKFLCALCFVYVKTNNKKKAPKTKWKKEKEKKAFNYKLVNSLI